MAPPETRVAVCFGGPSVEHDVSIISAQQLIAALDQRHNPIPIYLGRDGRMWTGDSLRDVGAFSGGEPAGAEPVQLRLGSPGAVFVRPSGSRLRGDEELAVDCAICAIHGTGGEDGALLGAFQLAGIAYAGGGVGPAAAAMNKATGKAVFRAAGIAVNPDLQLSREQFATDPNAAVSRAVEAVGLPCFAKPISLGSSIGVARCADEAELLDALELCFELDRFALVEPALDRAIEINCAVLGRPGDELRASVCEQPVKRDGDMLTFEEKYIAGGAKRGGTKAEGEPAGGGKSAGGAMAGQDRLIPAPISDSLTGEIQRIATEAHRALGFAGVVRYDFLVDDPEREPAVILNEANTVPGSFAFYLFEPAGLDFPALAEALLEIAIAEAAEERATTRTFESVLLGMHARGPKT